MANNKTVRLSVRLRKLRAGAQGRGITSANVVYALSYDNTQPANSAFVYDTIDEILFTKSQISYWVWEATEVTYTGGTTELTGAHSLNTKLSDLVSGEELYALADNGKAAPSTGWLTETEYRAVADEQKRGKWLWTRTRYVIKGGIAAGDYVYCEAFCVGYFGEDAKAYELLPSRTSLNLSKLTRSTEGVRFGTVNCQVLHREGGVQMVLNAEDLPGNMFIAYVKTPEPNDWENRAFYQETMSGMRGVMVYATDTYFQWQLWWCPDGQQDDTDAWVCIDYKDVSLEEDGRNGVGSYDICLSMDTVDFGLGTDMKVPAGQRTATCVISENSGKTGVTLSDLAITPASQGGASVSLSGQAITIEDGGSAHGYGDTYRFAITGKINIAAGVDSGGARTINVAKTLTVGYNAPGTPGTSAWTVNPLHLIISTRDNGTIQTPQGPGDYKQITGMYGGETATVTAVAIVGTYYVFTPSVGSQMGSPYSDGVAITAMTHDYYNADGSLNSGASSVPSGGFAIPRALNGQFSVNVTMRNSAGTTKTVRATVTFEVSLRGYFGKLINDIHQWKVWRGLVTNEKGEITTTVGELAVMATAVAAAVKVDGVTRAGMTLSEEDGAQFIANKFTIANPDAANNPFVIFDSVLRKMKFKGIIEAEGGTFSGQLRGATGDFAGQVTASSGNIAGFDIIDQMLTTSTNWEKCGMEVRQTETLLHTAVGCVRYNTNRLGGIFENGDVGGSHGGVNMALVARAYNATFNRAMWAQGQILTDGWISGYRFSKFVTTAANTMYGTIPTYSTYYTNAGGLKISENNVWFVRANHSNCKIMLPPLTEVRSMLGVAEGASFCVPFTVNADLGTTGFEIWGRRNYNTLSANAEWPVITNWDDSYWDGVSMGAGDSVQFMLVYDGTRTDNYGGYLSKYTARIVNRQN